MMIARRLFLSIPTPRLIGRKTPFKSFFSYNTPIMTTRTNEAWLSDLRSSGLTHEAALIDLRDTIEKGLPYALSRWLSPDNPLFPPLVEEVTQETILRVLDQLNTFEGRSMFTTWVHKIAIRIALTELRRKRWRDSSLEELEENEDNPAPAGLFADHRVGPETSAERNDLIVRVRRIIDEELTPKQREALVLLGLQDMPMEDAARKMKTNRNALYKLLHDARLRLKRRLTQEGLSPQDILSVFEPK
jgi:RNA polymerase sigma-70 factor (ECF subfamily)